MKNLFKILSICLCLSVMGLCATGCGEKETAKEQPLTYVALRINPEVELVVEGEAVVAVNPINEDGEVVITKLEDAIGKNIDEVCEDVTEIATEMGYIDVNSEDVTVNLEISGEKAEKVKELKSKIENKIHKFFTNRGIYGKVKEEKHETYVEIKAIATENNVSIHEAKIIHRILSVYPEMTIEEVLALSFKEKIELLKDNKNFGQITVDLKGEYKQEVEQIKAEYQDMFLLEKEIDDLKAKMESEELTEEELSALKAEIDQKVAEYSALKESFKEEIQTAKENFKEECKLKKEEYKAKGEQKIKDNKEKLEKHLKDLEENKQEIKDKIESWRKGKTEKSTEKTDIEDFVITENSAK